MDFNIESSNPTNVGCAIRSYECWVLDCANCRRLCRGHHSLLWLAFVSFFGFCVFHAISIIKVNDVASGCVRDAFGRYMNSAPLTCAPSIGKSIGTSGWCMSLDTCNSKSCTHSVPFPRRGIAGGVCLLRLYLKFVMSDDLLSCWLSAFKRKWGECGRYSYSCYSFVCKGCYFCLFIYNLLIIN